MERLYGIIPKVSLTGSREPIFDVRNLFVCDHSISYVGVPGGALLPPQITIVEYNVFILNILPCETSNFQLSESPKIL